MTKVKSKSAFRKWFGYLSNALLVLIILILLIPSWRVKFQGWFQGWFLSDVEFSVSTEETIPDAEKDWELFNMAGELINFRDFEGKPIVLNFWATWCPSCRAELPEISALKKEVSSEIQFIAVTEENIDLIHDSGLAEDFDFLYCTQDFPAYFKISSYPTLLIIDSHMNLINRTVGAGSVNNEKNKAFLNALLQNKF